MQVLNKVTNETPSPALVDAYLAEIARGYNLDWTPAPAPDLLNTLPDSADIFELLESSEVSTRVSQMFSPVLRALTGSRCRNRNFLANRSKFLMEVHCLSQLVRPGRVFLPPTRELCRKEPRFTKMMMTMIITIC